MTVERQTGHDLKASTHDVIKVIPLHLSRVGKTTKKRKKKKKKAQNPADLNQP